MDGGIPTYTPPPLQPTKWRTAPGFFGDQHRMDNTQLRNPTELPNNQTELYTMRTDDGLLWTHTLDFGSRNQTIDSRGEKKRGGGGRNGGSSLSFSLSIFADTLVSDVLVCARCVCVGFVSVVFV